MPWTVMHPAAPGGKAPGQDAGWLGKAFDPFHVEGDPNDSGFHVEGLGLPDGISPGRLADRRALLEQLAGNGRSVGQRTAIVGRLSAEGARRAWSRPRRAGPSRSTGKTRDSATATAGTSTASASCWPAGWSRRASAW